MGRELAAPLRRELNPTIAGSVIALKAEGGHLAADFRATWTSFPDRDDVKAVEKFLTRLREAVPGTGLEFEVEHHLESMQRKTKQSAATVLIVEDVFTISGRGIVVIGVLEVAEIVVGQAVEISTKTGVLQTVVTEIEAERKLFNKATVGMGVGLLFRNVPRERLSRGDVVRLRSS